MAQIRFYSTPVVNSTNCTLQINPWDCGGQLAPGDSTVVDCNSDGVIDVTHNIFYPWQNNKEYPPGWFCSLSGCADGSITLTCWQGGYNQGDGVEIRMTEGKKRE